MNSVSRYTTIICRLAVIVSLVVVGTGLVQGQEAPAKKKARISLSGTTVTDSIIILSAKVLTKEGRSYVPVPDVPVKFEYASDFIGTALSNELGIAKLTVPPKVALADSGLLMFKASIEGHDSLRDASRGLTIAKSRLDLELIEEDDSTRYVRTTLTAPDSSGEWIGVGEQLVRVYVKRLFGRLPVGEDFEVTDANGELVIPFPNDVRGDPIGNIILIAELEDHDDFGTVQAITQIDWGIPLEVDNMTRKELWSTGANSPLYLTIIINSLVLVIWGLTIYIITQLHKVWRNGSSTALTK